VGEVFLRLPQPSPVRADDALGQANSAVNTKTNTLAQCIV
jgi:hypothetical protein